jgi:hypothetical protein
MAGNIIAAIPAVHITTNNDNAARSVWNIIIDDIIALYCHIDTSHVTADIDIAVTMIMMVAVFILVNLGLMLCTRA